MTHPSGTRWLLVATFVAQGILTSWCVFAAPPAPPEGSTVYDADPQHLWNRLHDTFRARREVGGPTDPWELDPFLWRNNKYLSDEANHKAAVAILDEFLAKKGHTLIDDPLKRALLQRDLWTLFDSLPIPRWGAVQDQPPMQLATRLARILPRLSLTADEVAKLPNTYADAVAAKDPWFLPNDLEKPKSDWVLLSDETQLPLALTHTQFWGGRSAFLVFLRLPDGRAATEKLLERLRKEGEDDKPLPSGTQVALLRQMRLIDSKGKIVTTSLTESLQIRGQGTSEIKLSRKALLARKPSLKAVTEEEVERPDLVFMGNNAGNGPTKVLDSCFHCHQGRGIRSVLSYGRFQPVPFMPRVSPQLIASEREREDNHGRYWKFQRYEWGLLQGLIQNSVKD